MHALKDVQAPASVLSAAHSCIKPPTRSRNQEVQGVGFGP